MRALPARRIASSALCATLLLGIAGPAAMAADDSAHERTHAASHAPVPGAEALLGQVESLSDVGGVLTPVTDLLNNVLKADDGQLSAAEAEKLGTIAKDAIAMVASAVPAAQVPAAPATPTAPAAPTAPDTAAAPSTPAVPTAPDAPSTPAAPATPAASALPVAPSLPAAPPTLSTSDDSKVPPTQAPGDLVKDALAALQKGVDELLGAVTAGDVTKVTSAVTGLVKDLVNMLAATSLGGKLPAPDLAGLPQLPSAPAAPAAPVAPVAPVAPAAPAAPTLAP
ncbi:hypothetical protein ACIHJG_20970 [Streptomyces sp. NPDC052415]|uniref:hypothetical protein n=1 Tax=Streptomyces sp. NPDC052415 TaxID=3365690 RepID=UPI0037CF4D5F